MSTSDPTYTGAPKTLLKVYDPAHLDSADCAYNFQTVTLGSGKNTFSTGAGVTKGDLLNEDGTPVIKSIDGGSSGDNTLDLRKFDASLTASVSKPTGGSTSPFVFSVPGLFGDGAIAASNFQTLKLGSGDDSLSVQDGIDTSTLKAVDGGSGNNTLRHAAGASRGLDVTFAPAPPNPDGTPATAPWAAQIAQAEGAAAGTQPTTATNFQTLEFDTAADAAILTAGGAGGTGTLGFSGSVHGTSFSDTADTFNPSAGTELLAGDGQSFTTGQNDSAILLVGDGNTLAGSVSPGGLFAVAGSDDVITLPDGGAPVVIAPLGGAGSTVTVNINSSSLALRSGPGLVAVAGNYDDVYGGVQNLRPFASQDEADQASQDGALVVYDAASTSSYGYSAAPSGGHSDMALNGIFSFDLVSGDASIACDGSGIIRAESGTGPMNITATGGNYVISPSDGSTITAKVDRMVVNSDGELGNNVTVNAVGNEIVCNMSGHPGLTATVRGDQVVLVGPGLTADATGSQLVAIAEGYGSISLSGTQTVAEIVDDPSGASPNGDAGGRRSEIHLSGSNGVGANNGSGDAAITATGDRFFLTSGGGHDTLTATGDGNRLSAGSGNTTLVASGTGNALMGGSGDDTLQVLSGGGNTLVGGAGNNTLDGGSGSNTADYSAAPAGVVVDLGAGTASNGYGGTDTLKNIHSVVGSTFADVLAGTGGLDIFDGKGAPAGSQDYEQGNGGADTFVFNPGYGQVEINEGEAGPAVTAATLQLGVGITAGQVAITSDDRGNVILTDGTTGDRVQVDGMMNLGSSGQPGAGAAQVAFADGTTWTRQQVVALATTGVRPGQLPAIAGAAASQPARDTAPVAPFATVTVTDADAGEAATITLSDASGAATDANGLLAGAGLTQTGAGAYTLAASSPAALTAALAQLSFTPTPHQATPGQAVRTTFALQVTDSQGATATDATTSVVATAANTPPTITGTLPGQATASASATALAPFAQVRVTDPDHGASEAATLVLTDAQGQATDANGALAGAGLSRTAAGTYALAAASPDALASELAAVSFTPTANQLQAGQAVTTGITLAVTDDQGAVATDSRTTVVAAPGARPDTLVLNLSEDAWQGDAQFTATVDGVQLGAAQSVTALHGQGGPEAFAFTGVFGAGPHQVGVSFINDAWGGTAATDRNLYVDSISLDGAATPSAFAALYSNGTQAFSVAGPPVVPGPSAGPDTLVLHLSEDAWLGDAQFTASVDGRQLGAAQAVTALHGLGQGQDFAFTGNFGAGAHDLAVTFLNDAWGGTAATDRNLYVGSADLDGTRYAAATGPLMSNGTLHFQIGAPVG